jgi:two-component system chemotaxis sensor kinase CheA
MTMGNELETGSARAGSSNNVDARASDLARAVLRTSAEDTTSAAQVTHALDDLESAFDAWVDAGRAVLEKARRAAVDFASTEGDAAPAHQALSGAVAAVCEHFGPNAASLARSESATPAAPEEDDFIDFSNFGLEPAPAGTSAVAIAPAPLVDLRALPTFAAEAREHLDQADLHLVQLESSPDDPEALNALFRCMHTLKGSGAIVGLSPVKELAHEAEQVLDNARSKSIRVDGAVSDVLFEALDELRRVVEQSTSEAASGKPVSAIPRGDVMDALKSLAPGAMLSVPAPTLSLAPAQEHASTPIVSPSLAPRPSREPTLSAAPGDARGRGDVIRVEAARLDRFIDTIGELLIAESMVAHSPDLRASAVYAKLALPLGQLEKIARELQEMATSLRMVAVRDTFQRMHRIVRDVSRRCGKLVTFSTAGESIELDKGVVDQIADPLMHMLRNAVDHGLETPEDRLRTGKVEMGRIELRAIHAGNEVHIEVEDDGRGLDRDAILARGIERGLVREGEVLDDDRILGLVFEPGFSTAKTVTDVSGRGVGNDVVKRTVEALRGSVEVRTTPGKGALFRLRLPLTMAVIDGMLVAVGNQRYILPTLAVVRTVQRSEGEISQLLGGASSAIDLNDRWVPVRSLAELLSIRTPASSGGRNGRKLVVVVENAGRRLGLVVDELLGQQQVVIKTLGTSVGVAAVAGAAILPDGAVGLVLDLSALLDLSRTDRALAPAA